MYWTSIRVFSLSKMHKNDREWHRLVEFLPLCIFNSLAEIRLNGLHLMKDARIRDRGRLAACLAGLLPCWIAADAMPSCHTYRYLDLDLLDLHVPMVPTVVLKLIRSRNLSEQQNN